MLDRVGELWRNDEAAVAPIVALSMVGLLAAGGLAFDYAHLEALHTEVQSAADQAALSAATQLDGQSGACARAAAAAAHMLQNNALFANGSASRAVTVNEEATCDGTGNIQFYQSYDQITDTAGAAATGDANASVVLVQVNAKQALYALTPIVSLFSSGDITGTAIASTGHAICKVPPVMICNPAEPAGNSNENLGFVPSPGEGLNLVTGNATTPGNFGWLQANNGPGASNLGTELGYNVPPGDCQPSTGVTTETGMDASVLNAFNTRFDVYANGSTPCPGSGTCSPADVTRKDLVCATGGGTPTSCSNNPNWSEASAPYRLAQSCTGTGKSQVCTTPVADLPTSGGASDPTIMGYPPDECHMSPSSGACGITGDGKWDRNAYFRVNYGWADASTWQANTGLGAAATRYQVYQWERANHNPNGKGVGVPQKDSGNNYAFGLPATGHPGVAQSSSQADRRVMSVAVMNCNALNAHGKTTNAPVPTWMDVFLVQPAVQRGQGNNVLFSNKNVYVEMIGVTSQKTDVTAQVVRRDKPYLIK